MHRNQKYNCLKIVLFGGYLNFGFHIFNVLFGSHQMKKAVKSLKFKDREFRNFINSNQNSYI